MLFKHWASKVDDQQVPDVQIEADFWDIVTNCEGDKQQVTKALGIISAKRSKLAKSLLKDYEDSLKNGIGQKDECF